MAQPPVDFGTPGTNPQVQTPPGSRGPIGYAAEELALFRAGNAQVRLKHPPVRLLGSVRQRTAMYPELFFSMDPNALTTTILWSQALPIEDFRELVVNAALTADNAGGPPVNFRLYVRTIDETLLLNLGTVTPTTLVTASIDMPLMATTTSPAAVTISPVVVASPRTTKGSIASAFVSSTTGGVGLVMVGVNADTAWGTAAANTLKVTIMAKG